MLGSTAFFNASATLPDLGLFLDIDPTTDTIKDFFFDGPKVHHYKLELQELKLLCQDRTLEEVKKISRADLVFEVELETGKKALIPTGLWLLKKAIADYVGEPRYYSEHTDMVCLCFSVTKKDIVKKVLANKSFELKTLIQDTMASSACGTCKRPIEKIIEETRLSHGLIKGLDHSKSRFNDKGEWLQVAGLYPGELLIKLDELKTQWMKREGITDQFEIELVDIEGLHLTLEIKSFKGSLDEKREKALTSALSDYLKSSLGILFFLQRRI